MSASFSVSIIWTFDLSKGSIGEAVRRGNEFLHKASLLIPPEFAETKTAAGRRHMFRTREAHKARERWLTTSAGITYPDIPRYNLAKMLDAGLRRLD